MFRAVSRRLTLATSLVLLVGCQLMGCQDGGSDSKLAETPVDAGEDARATTLPATPEASPNAAKPEVADAKEGKKKRKSFEETAPVVGETAPDFELANLAGGTVRLSEVVPKGPAVLVFGSYS